MRKSEDHPSAGDRIHSNHLRSKPRQLTAARATKMFHLSSCVMTSVAINTTHASGCVNVARAIWRTAARINPTDVTVRPFVNP